MRLFENYVHSKRVFSSEARTTMLNSAVLGRACSEACFLGDSRLVVFRQFTVFYYIINPMEVPRYKNERVL